MKAKLLVSNLINILGNKNIIFVYFKIMYLSSLEPTTDAMEVKSMITHAPSNLRIGHKFK